MTGVSQNTGIRTAITGANFARYLALSARPMAERLAEIDHFLQLEKDFTDTKMLVRLLSHECAMYLDEIEITMFALHLHKLKEVVRYKNDLHLVPGQQGHVGEHSAKVVVLSDALFRETACDNETLAHMRRNYHIGTYMHDLGEILGEFYSFAEENNQRIQKRLDGDTKFAIEKDIALFASNVALYAAYTDNPSLYFDTIDDMRVACGVSAAGGLSIDPYEAVEKIRAYITAYGYPKVDEDIAEDIENRVTHRQHGLMRYYQQAEEFKGVGGPAVKIGQIIEGNQKFIAMVQAQIDGTVAHKHNDVVPYTLATSKRILGAYMRTESPLLALNDHAIDVPQQFEIAALRQREVYANLLSHITVEPEVLDRAVLDKDKDNPAADPEPRTEKGTFCKLRIDRTEFLMQAEQRSARTDDFRKNADDILARPTISSRTRTLLYTAAWLCRDFAPTDKEPLVLKRQVPPLLAPYVAVLDDVMDNGIDELRLKRLFNGKAQGKAVDAVLAEQAQVTRFLDDYKAGRARTDERHKRFVHCELGLD